MYNHMQQALGVYELLTDVMESERCTNGWKL